MRLANKICMDLSEWNHNAARAPVWKNLVAYGARSSNRFLNLNATANDRFGVIRIAPTGSKASQNVRYAFNGDRICASQRTDTMCQEET